MMTHTTARPHPVGNRIFMAATGLGLAACLALGGSPAQAKDHAQKRPPAPQVAVADAWIRATVPGQAGTGGFMKLTARGQALSLQGFSSPVADAAELHEMAMDGDVMRMRPVDALPLPKGQTVELKPGGHHLMLMGLKGALKAGSRVPVRLILKDAAGKTVEQQVTVPVLSAAPAGAAGGDKPSGHEHHDHADH